MKQISFRKKVKGLGVHQSSALGNVVDQVDEDGAEGDLGGEVDFGERDKTSPCLEATTAMVSMSRGDVGWFLVP